MNQKKNQSGFVDPKRHIGYNRTAFNPYSRPVNPKNWNQYRNPNIAKTLRKLKPVWPETPVENVLNHPPNGHEEVEDPLHPAHGGKLGRSRRKTRKNRR